MKIGLGNVLTIIVLICSVVFSYATLTAGEDELRSELSQMRTDLVRIYEQQTRQDTVIETLKDNQIRIVDKLHLEYITDVSNRKQ